MAARENCSETLLLAGLHDDFVQHRRAMAGEAEPLAGSKLLASSATYYRCKHGGRPAAQRRLAGGRRLPFRCVVDLVDAKPGIGKGRPFAPRPQRLLGPGPPGNSPAARAATRPPWGRSDTELLEQRLDEAKMDSGFDGLRRFLGFFGNQPIAEAARSELRDRLLQAGRVMEAELLMASTVDSTDRKAQATLLADMAGLNFRLNA